MVKVPTPNHCTESSSYPALFNEETGFGSALAIASFTYTVCYITLVFRITYDLNTNKEAYSISLFPSEGPPIDPETRGTGDGLGGQGDGLREP